MRIQLAEGVSFDARDTRVVADGLRVFISGEPGSGKSWAAMSIVSQWVEQGGQAVVLDAHGEYGGLWEARPRDVVRFGYGDHAVREESVDWCLSFVREGKTVTLDLSHWTDIYPEQLDAFVRKLMRDLYELRRQKPQQTMVLVEEAQSFAPQLQSAGQASNIKLFTSLITGGRKFGLNFILCSQRASLVDSNLIAACNVRLFMRTSEVKDWKRVVKEYLPPGVKVTWGGSPKTDFQKFNSGEALVISRWVKSGRFQLSKPSVPVKRFL